MKKLIGLSAVVLAVFMVDYLAAQDSGLFSGRGFKDGFGTKEASNSKSGTTAFGFYKGEQSQTENPTANSRFQFPKLELPKFKLPNWEMPKLFQGNQFPNAVQLSDSPSRGLLGGLSRSNRDPNQPNFFQRMNERTKEAFGRTRDGIANLTGGSGQSANRSGMWDRITRGPNGDIGGSGNRNQPPVQPNLRSARQTEGSTNRF